MGERLTLIEPFRCSLFSSLSGWNWAMSERAVTSIHFSLEQSHCLRMPVWFVLHIFWIYGALVRRCQTHIREEPDSVAEWPISAAKMPKWIRCSTEKGRLIWVHRQWRSPPQDHHKVRNPLRKLSGRRLKWRKKDERLVGNAFPPDLRSTLFGCKALTSGRRCDFARVQEGEGTGGDGWAAGMVSESTRHIRN